MTTRTVTRTRAGALASGALLLGLLGGCADPLPQPDPEPPAETPPAVLDANRLDRVMGDVQATIDAADEERDPELLDERVAGPALRMRTAEYAVADATDGDNTPTTLTMDTQVEAVAATESFPRSVIAVSQIPEGENLPLITALRQEDAREPYRLWAWATAFPGVEIPATVRPEIGSGEVPADAEELVASPADALSFYVETLDDPESENASLFGADPFMEEYRSSVSELDEAIEEAGEAEADAEVGEDGVVALQAAEGGAIVLGDLRYTLTMRKTEEGSTLEAGGTIGALLGDDTEVRGEVSGTYLVTVALYVPPAGEDATIEVLGAAQALADVSRNDEAAP